jgi:signal transduction histidine kinase/ligand-binding sensor domain-containing protein
MNPRPTLKPQRIFFMALLFLSFNSCNRKSETVPFADVSEYYSPKAEPLQFNEPKKIEWLVNDSTTFSRPIVKKVDLENLPTKPFYPDGFLPLTSPMEEITFDFKSLPDTLINFKEVVSKPIEFKTSIIEPPLLVPAGLPKIKKNAAIGIFEFGEDQGLPGYVVSAMMEDSHGMMWIGTDKGLCRFNGEYLEIYKFIDAIFTGALADILSMVEDKKGRIWIYTAEKGIYVLDLKAGVVSNFIFSKQEFNFNADCSMIMDSRGLIWLGTNRDGLYILDPKDDTYRHIGKLCSQDTGNAKNITEDSSGNTWVSTATGLAILDFDSGRTRFLNDQKGLSVASVTALFRDSQNRIWVGTQEKGISILDEDQGKIQHLGPAQGFANSIHHFTEGNDKKLWLSSNVGAYIIDPSKQRLQYLNTKKGLSDDHVHTTYLERQGQIWIATGTALNLMDTEGLMPNFLTAADGLSGPDVWSFFEDAQDHLWIGSRQGIDIYDPERNRIKKVDNALQLTKSGGISYRIQQMPNGEYLIVAPRLGLGIFNPKQQSITMITAAQGLNNPFPASSLVDRSGRIWTGTFQNGGVEYIDLQNNIFKVLTNKNGLVGNIVWELWEDNLGQIWVATDKGINIINVADNTISQLMEGGKISERNGGAFLEDAQQRLWIGTRSGLLIADQKKGLLTVISTENGLTDPAVYTLYENKGEIYVGTGNGFTVFTPKQKKSATEHFDYDVKSYGKAQGLIYTDFNAGSAIAYKDKLWWGIETQAMTVMNIPQQDSTSSVTYISGITISDRTQNFYDNSAILKKYSGMDTLYSAQKDTFYISGKLPKETGWLKENKIQWDSLEDYFNLPVNLKIPFEQNFISFQFTGTQMTNRDKTRYRYFLEGFDTQWSDITEKPYSENYRNLPAGKYTFKVSSRTLDGIWSLPAEFSFTILPHWTNTWWAWLLYALTFLIVVGSIVQYRARMLKKENLILEEKVKHRTAQLNKSVEDLKATQSQLVQSEKMASLGELTAGIAHEIQNPLNFVNNFSEVNKELLAEMAEEIKNGNIDEVKSLANDIADNEEKIIFHGKRADAIVKGMLQHSRASSGQKEPTDINLLADEYLRLAYHGLRAKDKSFNATLKTDFDKSIGNINVVPQDIGRVILNLITNAFYVVSEKSSLAKASEEDYEPTVWVSTKKEKNQILISVKDNGNGIPQKALDKIFQPFFTTKPTGQGTGLGLSLSYDIVMAHGGELRVETKEGEGTEFTIALPA